MEKKYSKKLFKLTWPIFIEQMLFMLLGSIDIFMLGKYSDNAVAAVGVVNQVINMLNLLFGIITTGTMIICAQYIGARNKEKDIIRLCGVSLIMNLLIGLIISIFLLVCDGFILKVMNIAPELINYSSDYLKVVGGFIFIQAIASTFASIIRSHGYTKICMLVTLAMNIINVICNYIFIFGNFGFPRLGVVGAAISTTLSRVIAAIILGVITFKVVLKSFSLKLFNPFPFNELKKIINLGLPAAGESLSYNLSKLVGTIVITHIGVSSLTANSYVSTIDAFIYLFAVSIGQGASILIGRFVGSGENEKAYKLCFDCLKKSIIASIIIAVLIAIFSRSLLGFFTSNDEIISLGAMVLIITIFLEPGRACNIVVIDCLRASGDVKFPVIVGICSQWAVGVGLASFFAIILGLGLPGLWIGLATDECFRGLIMVFRWRSKKWQGKSVVAN